MMASLPSFQGAISGVGIDLVDVSRIEKSLKEYGPAFLKRIAHAEDLLHAPANSDKKFFQFWASRFAVKEAFSKAFGTGIGAAVSFTDIGVRKLPSGEPLLVVSDKLLKQLQTKGVGPMHLSLSHTETMAIAIVILEKAIDS